MAVTRHTWPQCHRYATGIDEKTYSNPVIGGFHPDPSVCRVGADYYLACSSFEYFPGVPVFHSRDLVHWRQLGNVLARPSQLDLPPDAGASGGIYAPTIRHHDGRFWLITTNVSGRGNFIVTADQADGPWSDPVWVDLPGVDPDLAWDTDGSCLCTFSGIRQARIDPERGTVLEGPWPVWSGTGLQYPEGPHLYRRGDWWYLLLSEGGTHTGHSVSVARSRYARGPFEPTPGNPILSHRSTDRPIQSTGHAELVQAPDGNWWLVLLGTRPRGHHPGWHVLGRETFLTPVTWVDDWPVIGPVEEHHRAPAEWQPRPPDPARDDFDAATLAPPWISPRSRPAGAWSLGARPGWLTLHATGPTLDRPGATFIGRAQQHHEVRVTARLDPGTGRGGLSIRIDEAHHYDVEVGAGEARAVARIGPVRQCLATAAVPPGPVDLTVEVRGPGTSTGPDIVVLSVSTGEPEPVLLAELDGRYLSTEVAGGFTGRVIGMYATEGSVSFDWYRVSR